MPGEQARALAYHGRACVALGQPDQARTLLAEAERIYTATDMPVGAAIARLITAQLDLQAGDYAAAHASILSSRRAGRA
jgi:ATP/maltotriose-dependent transcriptional regulator MalT